MKIGVLALQGAVSEHEQMLADCGVDVQLVKGVTDLIDLDGLVIPGGESTTIKKLLAKASMLSVLKDKILAGMPVLGTCAGLVLLTQDDALNGLDGQVQRNGFGRQIDSFEENITITGLDHPFPGIFIRAPYLETVGPEVEILGKTFDNRIIAARQKNVMVTAFHPELSEDSSIHELFITQCVNENKMN
ncbi:pyridoxal 5'-phosphate synthase glutaminase subunit PdxT [Convivina intestini]|uniref:Pyridoxal 5'-phosphate synthase subunit PdxT n=1 Tax=Convivina intestini TaxID=1505726 RepID=A0A2U1DF35_9LACO|nr:pyridoxal 5'-phosphate synthase glutaminase subunit PdxT [Convivina intestini]PVY86295.1 5'-phosphate synthase pdxT subunit [Convivina intestini]CAH1850991.1 Pyridoxal 5'-phosphate synthase subunit PdxT [Convivina intestini]SDB82256.1 pyridoxal phosphate synthase yaaE subunit [Leuconostocaceae bacterium R-53105]